MFHLILLLSVHLSLCLLEKEDSSWFCGFQTRSCWHHHHISPFAGNLRACVKVAKLFRAQLDFWEWSSADLMLEKRKVGTEAEVGQFTKKIEAGFCESSSSTSPSSLYYSHPHDRTHRCGRTIDKEDHQEDRFGKPATRTWANSAFTQVQRFSCSISSKKWNAKQLRLTSLKSMDQHFVLLWSTTQGGIHTSHQAPIV